MGRDLRVLVGWTLRHWAPVALTLFLQLAATLSLGIGIALLVPAAAALFGARVEAPLALGSLLPIDASPMTWLIAVILLIAARNTLVVLAALTTARFVHDLVLDLRKTAAEQLLHLPVPTLESVGIGDLVQRANGEVHRVAQATKALVRILAQSGAVAVFTILMLYFSWRLSALILCTLVLLLPFWRWVGSATERSGRRLSSASRRYARSLQEILWGLRVIRDVGGVDRERARLATHARDRERAALRSSAVSAWVAPLTETSIVIGVALTLAVASFYAGGEVTPSQTAAVLTVLALLSRWMPAAASVAAAWGQLSEHLGAVRAVAEFLSWDRISQGGSVSLENGQRLELSRLTFHYPDSTEPTLTEIDLAISRGEIVGVVGASGAGKSTLAALIARHLAPTAGDLTIDEVPLSELDRVSLCGLIHVLPQEAILFDGSIRENITYPASTGPATQVQHSAQAAGLNSLLERFSAGLDSPVGERGSRLSGGERQRVALARAFYRKPSFLVLDESTSAVDEATERGIARFLRENRSCWGCLVIAHRPASIRIADRIVVFKEGRVVGEGSHERLLSDCAEYRRLYQESEDRDSGSDEAVSAADL